MPSGLLLYKLQNLTCGPAVADWVEGMSLWDQWECIVVTVAQEPSASRHLATSLSMRIGQGQPVSHVTNNWSQSSDHPRFLGEFGVKETRDLGSSQDALHDCASSTVWEDSVALFLLPSPWAAGSPSVSLSWLRPGQRTHTRLSGIFNLQNYCSHYTQTRKGLGEGTTFRGLT